MDDAQTQSAGELAFAADRENTYFPLTNLKPGEVSDPFEVHLAIDTFWNTETVCVDVCEKGRGTVAKLRAGNEGYETLEGLAKSGTFAKGASAVRLRVRNRCDERPAEDSYEFIAC